MAHKVNSKFFDIVEINKNFVSKIDPSKLHTNGRAERMVALIGEYYDYLDSKHFELLQKRAL